MIKKLNLNELVFSDFLVEKPVNRINKMLSTRTSKNKIILAGGRGTGKSVILKKRELDGVATKKPAIYMDLFAPGLVGVMKNRYFNDDFMKHYYEAVMESKLLQYIKVLYPELYYSEFSAQEQTISDKMDSIYNCIINGPYRAVTYKTSETFNTALSIFRDQALVKEVTLIIDRFDWIHNSDPRVQEILKQYFDLFDKVIITSDDPTILQDERYHDLSNKGFEVLELGYFKESKTIKQIVEKRFKVAADEEPRLANFPVGDITLSDYEMLIGKTGGNIKTIIDIVGDVESQYYWRKKEFDISEQLNFISTNKLKEDEKATEMYPAKRLHL